ncbi:tripartite-type tricarboxylate transporter receptor subunit TctC [Pseudacidovorax sp. 1753]|uniref:Bug family tripartite tricarboxylate transporter substrate binding protein n=1 Tax=Pseudacidovorax sp. 1753 TaxID=3156419 RepID=UPI003394D9FE
MRPGPFLPRAVRRRTLARLLALAAAAPALACLAPAALAAGAAFPVDGKPIRIVVGFTAGGGTDAQARIVAKHLGEVLGTAVLVDNRPGASTMLAASEVARALPDGHTLLYAPSSTMAQNPHTFAKVPYDPFKDFTPISLGGRGPLVLSISSGVPAANVAELVAYVKARPGQTSYASFGAGTSSHIYGEAFVRKAGIDSVHVPYKGGSDAAKDLMAGRVPFMFDSASSAVIAASSGKVRILAVAAEQRIPALPDVPTLSEQGFTGLDLPSWLGFYGPAGMAAPTVQRLNAALAQVLALPEVRKFYRDGGYEAGANSPDAFAQLTRRTYEQWGAMVRQVGLQAAQ